MRQPGACVRALCEAVAVLLSKNMTCAITLQCNTKRTFPSDFTLRSSHPHFTLHTSHVTLHTSSHLKPWEFFSPHLSSSHLIPSLLTCHLSKLFSQMHLHRKAFTKCFLLQSLHRALPSTTLYYKACTTHLRVALGTANLAQKVLLCTTNLAQNASLYYFVLRSLRKALPSTTLYYKACTEYSPVLLSTTKLAQSTSQYYFVLQILHNVLPSTTLY